MSEKSIRKVFEKTECVDDDQGKKLSHNKKEGRRGEEECFT